MGTRLDPYIHEHDTVEEAEAFDRALCERVERARNSVKQSVPHEQVMKEARALLDAQRAKNARKRD